MFISISDLNIEVEDEISYFSITPLDVNGNPEKTLRFRQVTNFKNGKWLQVRFCKTLTSILKKNCLKNLKMKLVITFKAQLHH